MQLTFIDEQRTPSEDLTYLDLLNHIAQERGWEPGGTSYRPFKAHIAAWCRFRKVSLESPAAGTLMGSYEEPMNRLTELLCTGDTQSPDKAKNIRWAVSELRRVYDSLRISNALPTDYREALHQAIRAKGWTNQQFVAAVKKTYSDCSWCARSIYDHLNGKKLPDGRRENSIKLVTSIELALDLQAGVLASRAFKVPHIIKVGNSKKIPYRIQQFRLKEFDYSLPKLPASFEKFWNELVYWRQKSSHTIEYGGMVQIYTVPPEWRWNSSKTEKKYKKDILNYLGWLTLPLPTKPLYDLTDEESWSVGRGLKIDELNIPHLFNLDLVWQFIEFLRRRQTNKSFTQANLHFLFFLNSLVSHPYSFIKTHDELAPTFSKNLQKLDWVNYVEENIHLPILALTRQLRKVLNDVGRQRNPNEPLAEIFQERSPFLYIQEMLVQMKKNLPPVTHRKRYAAQLRDIALVSMGMEVPLRCRNFAELKLGSDLIKDPVTNLWKIFIPKNRLKNRNSKYAQNINRTYSAETSDAIDKYLDSGRIILNENESQFFFLAASSNSKRISYDIRHPAQMSESSISNIVRKNTKIYFGTGIGANLFRHLLATAILKDAPGNLEVAAAVLNNSPNTVKDNYKHVTQQDGLHVADEWFLEQKKLHAKLFSGDF